MISYKGFRVGQAKVNNNIVIAKDKKLVHHEPCDRSLTEKELKREVDRYLEQGGGRE